jgi:hypothetical protein
LLLLCYCCCSICSLLLCQSCCCLLLRCHICMLSAGVLLLVLHLLQPDDFCLVINTDKAT